MNHRFKNICHWQNNGQSLVFENVLLHVRTSVTIGDGMCVLMQKTHVYVLVGEGYQNLFSHFSILLFNAQFMTHYNVLYIQLHYKIIRLFIPS